MSGGVTSILALLNLPAGSTLTLDGESVMLKRYDFVGFYDLPTSVGDGANDFLFHLVTARAGSKDASGASSCATTVGFVLLATDDGAGSSSLVRRYDPTTEEVSSTPVDERTAANLIQQIQQGKVDPQRVVSYHKFMPGHRLEHWKGLTSFVSPRLLERRGIRTGAKLIPGAYCDSDDEATTTRSTNMAENDNASSNKIVDGSSVQYPPIPYLQKSTKYHATSHAGTKLFMTALSPAQRTAFFMDDQPTTLALNHLLSTEYDNQHRTLLGDLQLCYVLFQNLHCLASLNHWRDLVAMLSALPVEGMTAHVELYTDLLGVLSKHVGTMEDDFFEDVEFSGDDNFLVPSFQRLVSTLTKIASKSNELSAALARFHTLLSDKFPDHFAIDNGDDDMAREDESNKMVVDNSTDGVIDAFDDDDDDEDAPLVVDADEVEASMVRSSEMAKLRRNTVDSEPQYDRNLREQYPLLFAAMDATSTEDVLMTCARALDEANDVSLVREAAAYLEEVEAKKL